VGRDGVVREAHHDEDGYEQSNTASVTPYQRPRRCSSSFELGPKRGAGRNRALLISAGVYTRNDREEESSVDAAPTLGIDVP
jgi:hypothetical protein